MITMKKIIHLHNYLYDQMNDSVEKFQDEYKIRNFTPKKNYYCMCSALLIMLFYKYPQQT